MYIDYRKAFESVPHGWLIRLLETYKIDPLIINSLQQLTKKYVGHIESKERLRIQPAQLFHFS